MMNRLVKKIGLILVMLGATSGAGTFAANATANDPPINYQTQLLQIFRAASGHGGPVEVQATHGDPGPKQKAALETIYQDLLHNKIFLKNVVWRPDLKVIRITWADNANHYIFKIVYKVSHDPVLTNSVYADKRQVIDVKIMYLDNGKYRYLHLTRGAPATVLQNGAIRYHSKPGKGIGSAEDSNGLFGYYDLNAHVSAEQCKFCHMLVRGVNGKPGGIFFPRYQETDLDRFYKQGSMLNQPLFFRAMDFKPIDPTQAPVRLPGGLPNPVMFNRINLNDPATKNLYTMYVRTMFEAPQLVEAMARDNHESACISVNFDSAAPLFGHDNYVCADAVRKTLFVKFKNPLLSSGSGKVQYEKPYYKDE